MNVITLFGNIGSGKSTVSKRLMDLFPNLVYLNDDTIWHMTGGGAYQFRADMEPGVLQALRLIAISAISTGKDVLVDIPAHTHARRQMFEIDPTHVNHVAIHTGWHEDPAHHADYRFKKDSRKVSYETWLKVATRLASERELPVAPWKVIPVGRIHSRISQYQIGTGFGSKPITDFSGGLSGLLEL